MRLLPIWVDEPMPLITCRAHVLAPFEDLSDSDITHRCVLCGQLAGGDEA